MTVIQYAEKRLNEEIHQNDLGANNDYAIDYWRAYLDGARAQMRELTAFPSRREDENEMPEPKAHS